MCTPLLLLRCAIASFVASDLSRFSRMILIKLIKMWMHLFVLRLCSFVSFSHSLRLAFLHLFRLFPSRLFLFTADIMSPQSATALMESKVPSWGNLVASYVSGSAVIVLSIQTWEGTPPGSLRQSARRGTDTCVWTTTDRSKICNCTLCCRVCVWYEMCPTSRLCPSIDQHFNVHIWFLKLCT